LCKNCANAFKTGTQSGGANLEPQADSALCDPIARRHGQRRLKKTEGNDVKLIIATIN